MPIASIPSTHCRLQYVCFFLMRGSMTHSFQQHHSTPDKRSQALSLCSNPHFFNLFLQDKKTTFWGALLGNDWGLNRLCLTMLCILCLIYICFTMVSLILCVIKCLPVIIFLFDASPLIAVVPRWSRHLFLGRLREWDSLCCWFGTGDWHLTCLSHLRRWIFLTFHHLPRAL